MVALNYPPHVTLAIYDNISVGKLRETLRAVFGARARIRLRFDRLAYFEQPQLVFWAAPEASDPLLHAHAALHRLIHPSLCREHYRPGAWVPHCTLATDVSPNNRQQAFDLADQKIAPFDVVFDKADCVEFMSVRVLEEYALSDDFER